MSDQRRSAALDAASRRRQNDERLAQLRLDRAAAERRRDSRAIEDASREIEVRQLYARDLEQADRVAQAAILDTTGVTRRMRELQEADKTLTPLERSEFRARVEPEQEALGARVRELAGQQGTPAPSPSKPRAEARATYDALRAQGNYIGAAAFAQRMGDALIFGDGGDDEGGGGSAA